MSKEQRLNKNRIWKMCIVIGILLYFCFTIWQDFHFFYFNSTFNPHHIVFYICMKSVFFFLLVWLGRKIYHISQEPHRYAKIAACKIKCIVPIMIVYLVLWLILWPGNWGGGGR